MRACNLMEYLPHTFFPPIEHTCSCMQSHSVSCTDYAGAAYHAMCANSKSISGAIETGARRWKRNPVHVQTCNSFFAHSVACLRKRLVQDATALGQDLSGFNRTAIETRTSFGWRCAMGLWRRRPCVVQPPSPGFNFGACLKGAIYKCPPVPPPVKWDGAP